MSHLKQGDKPEEKDVLGKWSYVDRIHFAITRAQINNFSIISLGIPQEIQNYIIQEMSASTDHPRKKGKLSKMFGHTVKLTKELQITTRI